VHPVALLRACRWIGTELNDLSKCDGINYKQDFVAQVENWIVPARRIATLNLSLAETPLVGHK